MEAVSAAAAISIVRQRQLAIIAAPLAAPTLARFVPNVVWQAEHTCSIALCCTYLMRGAGGV